MRDVCKTQDKRAIKWNLINPMPVVSYCKYVDICANAKPVAKDKSGLMMT
mgnify:CR=1 FL=1